MTSWKAALKSLVRRPAFAITAILVLAFGIGANSAIFSIVDTVLLKPLPYRNGDRIVWLLDGNSAKNERESLISPARLADWARLASAFDAISGTYTENVTDSSLSEPERLAGRRVAPGYFSVFSMRPLAGRTFLPVEEKFGGPQAAVISEGVWTRRYHRDPRVIGAHLLLSGTAYTIVGVMPKEFATPAIDVWMPAQIAPGLMQHREARFFIGVGRMKAGVTVQQGTGDLARFCQRLAEIYPATDKGWSVLVSDYKQHQVGGDRRALVFVLFAAVLLLILCANIAGLLLGQLQRREREFAIRGSLGASRTQIAAVVLREIALLACCSAALGLALAAAAIRMAAHVFSELPRIQELRFDWRLVLFTIALSAVALVFGVAPVLHSAGRELNSVLAQGGRTQAGGQRLWQRTMVTAQFAITLVLLAGAGLLLRSYYNLTRVQPGFEASHVLTFHVGAEWGEDRGKIGLLQQELIARLEQLPAVRAAGFSNFLPASGATLREQVSVEGFPQAGNNGQITTGTRSVTEGYLRALQIPLLEGSSCPQFRLDKNAATKVLVNKRFADLLGGSNLIGRHLGWSSYSGTTPAQIAGVVGDVNEDALNAPAVPYVYVCIVPGAWPDPEYVVAAHGGARGLIASVRQVVHELAPQRAMFGLTTVADYLEQTLDQPRLNAGLVSAFAISALLSAALGLYGLVMLAVISRTKEIGVRMALGAAPARIVTEILIEAVRPLAPAIIVGLAIALGVLRLFRSVLFEVTPFDTLTFLCVCVLLFAIAIAAALAPSRRAATVDPVEALRSE
jgi:putative ABC transport system permease protein